MQETPNPKLKIGVAIGLFVIAGGIAIYATRGPEVPESIEKEKTVWYCTNCKTGFELPADAPPEMFQVQEEPASDASPSPRRRGGASLGERYAKCPNCGEFKGVPGVLCGGCGKTFRKFNKEGVAMICPDCKWDPTTGQTAEGDRLYVLDE